MTDEAVSPVMVEKIIEAGTFAPTHKRTDPWRFVVFEGEGRNKLSEAMVAGYKNSRDASEISAEKLHKMEASPFRAPVIILVWCAAGRGKINPPLWEDHAAVAACLQNMSLAAHGFGLGSVWRSGDVGNWPEVQAFCKTEDDHFKPEKGDMVMGLLYVGHKNLNYPEPLRTPEQPKISWVK